MKLRTASHELSNVTEKTTKKRNRRVAIACCALFLTMIGAAYAAVPLYDWFCRVTGFGGATQRAAVGERPGISERSITVRFDANVSDDLPWDFYAETPTLTLPLGEVAEIFYRAQNTGGTSTVGMATFNVAPHGVGPYFNKIECFCFNNQPLEPGESAELGVQFFVDPAIADDLDVQNLREITLSYTFFPTVDYVAPPSAVEDDANTTQR